MHRRTVFLFAAALVAALAAGFGWRSVQQRSATPASPSLSSAAAATSAVEGDLRDREIALFERRAAEDAYSAGDRARLATLFLQRSRATGSYEDVLEAERFARRSLALRTAHNSGTYLVLAVALLDQHRFADAYEAAKTLVELDPEPPIHRAVLGETQMELGRYEEARVTFTSLEGARSDLNVVPRLARWAELNGRTTEARDLLLEVEAQAGNRADLPADQRVVFHYRVGELELRHGRLKQAERAFLAGLAADPEDYRLLAAMAKLKALQQHWKSAIRYGDRAIALVLDPATLGVISDAYAASGDSARAAEYARTMEVAIRGQKKGFHREWSLFLLDHNRRVPQVLAQVQEEIQTRKDIYGYDLLAWALYKQGRLGEAKTAMSQALRLGTEDASLFFHAGMIERGLGNRAAAAAHLRRALEINPHFDVSHPAVAEAVLDSITTEAPRRFRLPF